MPLRKHGDGTDTYLVAVLSPVTEEESAHKVNSGEENSPAAPAGIRTRSYLSMTSPSPLPPASAPRHVRPSTELTNPVIGTKFALS